jgi:hypothetical protein
VDFLFSSLAFHASREYIYTRELIELWREHDSTGLRAEPKLIHTALAVRVAPKTRASSFASEATQQNGEKGSPALPFFYFSADFYWLEVFVLWRR